MRDVLLIVFIFFTMGINAQSVPEAITANDLYSKIDKRDKPSFLVFWNPNCETGEETLLEYQGVINKYSHKIDIYVIGLTNMPDLMVEMSNKIGLDYPLYYLGGNKSVSIFDRKEKFSSELFKLTNKKSEDFIMAYIKDLDKVDYIVDTVEIDYNKLDSFLN